MATQDGDLEIQPSIRDIDYTQGQIVILLATQTNDRERYALMEKIILELVNKNERPLKKRKDLLETRDIERKELLDKNDKLLVVSVQQLGRIQTLEKQLESVQEYPGDNNIKKTPAFIHIPDTKVTRRHFEYIEIVKSSDLQTSQCYNARALKPKERAYLVDGLTTARANYPVTNYKGMCKVIQWIQQKLHSNSLHACANILQSKTEDMDLYKE